MCGIAGIFELNNGTPDTAAVERMNHVIRHRGPDGRGIMVDGPVALGHVRLSIIDVEGSSQPLANEDQTVWTTFNGEIYNYRDLRRLLLDKGHVFKTAGDTETLVHLYEEYGCDMVNHLAGMFAFAVWDSRKQMLILARDRMGIKPAYYYFNNNRFVFASEQKAFFQVPDIKVSPSAEGIWHYLTYRSAPSPGTLFDGIIKLRPGCMLTVTRKGIKERRYWDIPLKSDVSISPVSRQTDNEIMEEFESLLQRTVGSHLVSDVPLGAFLSGGVDSSLIVAMMSKLTGTPVRTYSVGFENFRFSELPYAGAVARQYGTDHHELILKEDCFAANLEKLTWYRDSPLSEPADVPLYLLADMARRDVKVLLSGEGSDEIFAGYPKYAWDRFAPVVSILPERLTDCIAGKMPSALRRIEIAMRSLSIKECEDRWAQWFAPFTPDAKSRLFVQPQVWPNPTAEYARTSKKYEQLDAMLYTDCKLWLPDNLLDRGDRMTMGASVEGRVPFLDHHVDEYAFSLRRNLKVRRFTGKWLVKQLAEKYLPAELVNRRKVGFALPLAQWFRGRLRDMCYDRICCNKGVLRQIMSHDELQKILNEHNDQRKDNSLKIWTLLGLAVWDEVFFGDTKNNKYDE